jgi:hypothetical protein
MSVLDSIPGSDQKVIDYAAAHSSGCFENCPLSDSDLRLLLDAVRNVITGQLVLTTSQEHDLLSSIDVLIEAL